MKITFIQTGGTIDKDYPRKTKGYAFEIADPAVSRILQRTNPNFTFEILSVLKKDSLEMTEEDRKQIFEACNQTDVDKIIITHGTDTMIDIARKLSAIKDKVIILKAHCCRRDSRTRMRRSTSEWRLGQSMCSNGAYMSR